MKKSRSFTKSVLRMRLNVSIDLFVADPFLRGVGFFIDIFGVSGYSVRTSSGVFPDLFVPF